MKSNLRIPFTGPSEGEDAGAWGEEQPQQWLAINQEEVGRNWKPKGKWMGGWG